MMAQPCQDDTLDADLMCVPVCHNDRFVPGIKEGWEGLQNRQ